MMPASRVLVRLFRAHPAVGYPSVDVNEQEEKPVEKPTYPRLIKRVRAALIDSFLLPVLYILSLLLGNALGIDRTTGMIVLILFPLMLLDPALVAFTGGTIGHHVQGIRVVHVQTQDRIHFLAALLRFITKFLFGWLSFVLVLTTAKHQTLHDLVSRSRVVHKNPLHLPAHEVLAERQLDVASYTYPPLWRRLVVIVVYAILATIGYTLLLSVFSSADCMVYDQCGTFDLVVQLCFSVLWLLSTGWVFVLGWTGCLPGARKRAIGKTT